MKKYLVLLLSLLLTYTVYASYYEAHEGEKDFKDFQIHCLYENIANEEINQYFLTITLKIKTNLNLEKSYIQFKKEKFFLSKQQTNKDGKIIIRIDLKSKNSFKLGIHYFKKGANKKISKSILITKRKPAPFSKGTLTLKEIQ